MKKYFLHQIKHNQADDTWDKGIVVKDTLDAARQSGDVGWRQCACELRERRGRLHVDGRRSGREAHLALGQIWFCHIHPLTAGTWQSQSPDERHHHGMMPSVTWNAR
jgi:hypothetical protein